MTSKTSKTHEIDVDGRIVVESRSTTLSSSLAAGRRTKTRLLPPLRRRRREVRAGDVSYRNVRYDSPTVALQIVVDGQPSAVGAHRTTSGSPSDAAISDDESAIHELSAEEEED